MNPWNIARTIDLAKWQRGVEHIGVLAYSSNANGHRLTLTILHGGQPESLGGYSIRAYFLLGNPEKPDAMIPKDGAITGNVVTVAFPAAAYSREQAGVMVCAEKTGEQIPLYGARYNVRTGSADKVIDPDDIVPSLPELLAQIDAMKSATQAGQAQQAETAQAEAEREAAEDSRVNAEKARVSEHNTNQKASAEQTARAKAAADKLSEFEVQVESLPPSADPTAKVTQTSTKTTVALGIPTSNFAYATFYINPETRQLVMRVPNGFSAIQFAIKDRRLVVRINGE